MNKIIIILLFNLLLYNLTIAQNNKQLDSLSLKLKTISNDTNKVNILNQISDILSDSKPDEAIKYAQKANLLSNNLNFKKGIAKSLSIKGRIFQIKGDYNKSILFFEQALKINIEINNKQEISETEKYIGIIYEKQRKYDKALTYYLKSLKNKQEINDRKGIASGYNNIATIYLYQLNFDIAKEYYFKALKIVEELNFKIGIATILSNIATIYFQQDSIQKAIKYNLKSLKVRKEIGNNYGIAQSLNNIGNCYSNKKIKMYDSALYYYKQSLVIKEEIGDKNGIASTYISIGGGLFKQEKKYSDGINYLKKGLEISKETGDIDLSKNAYDNLSEIYSMINDYENAYKSHVEYSKYNDSILNKENSRAVSELQEQYNAKEREQEILVKNNEIQKNELKIKQQKTFQSGLIIGILLLLALAIVILNGYRQKKKANILLASQNEEILQQKSVIEEKNRDIMASITYAKRIQDAILPPDKHVKQILDNYFILFKPKDIVSGDFYWIHKNEDKTLFSVVDCTGHGVPGAFMSIVGYNGLNQAVAELGFATPGKLLDKLNEIVELTLHQSGKYDVKDGMDLALCSFDKKTGELEYAGANNPLYLVRATNNNLIINNIKIEPSLVLNETYLYEIKADKQPIGAYSERQNFTNHKILLEKGDSVYVFSDGFADQFGGPENKKFKYKPFKQQLLTMEKCSLDEQKIKLNKTIEDWKGLNEQVDDICVIGVKY